MLASMEAPAESLCSQARSRRGRKDRSEQFSKPNVGDCFVRKDGLMRSFRDIIIITAMGCAGVWFGAIRAGGFLPVKAAGGCKTVASAYFCGCGPCTQYDPKVILGAKALDPKGDAYYGS